MLFFVLQMCHSLITLSLQFQNMQCCITLGNIAIIFYLFWVITKHIPWIIKCSQAWSCNLYITFSCYDNQIKSYIKKKDGFIIQDNDSDNDLKLFTKIRLNHNAILWVPYASCIISMVLATLPNIFMNSPKIRS